MLVDAAHRPHARVVRAGHRRLVPAGAGRLLVPVVDAAHEGRDQLHPGLAAGHGLGKREQQRQVAVDAAPLQSLGSADAFPGAGDLDQHAVDVHALGLVQLDQALGARHRGFGVERQARVHLGGDAPGDQRQDLAAKAHQQPVDHLVQRLAAVARHGVGQQRGVFGLLHRLQDQRRVGGGVARLVLRDLPEVAGVGDHGGELLEGVELVHGARLSLLTPRGHGRPRRPRPARFTDRARGGRADPARPAPWPAAPASIPTGWAPASPPPALASGR